MTKRVVRWQILHRFPLRPTRVQPTRLESGLRYCDLVPGDGPQVDLSSRVKLHYLGSLLDGNIVFDTYSQGFPETFVLADAPLAGFREGLQGMRVGGKRKLLVPPELAYGDEGLKGFVPPNATVVFDIEVLDVKN